MNLLVLCKRRYTARDLIGERFGRLYHLPVELAARGHKVTVLCLDYPWRKATHRGPEEDGVTWHSVAFPFSGLSFKHRAIQLARATSADLILGMSDSIYAIWARAVARRVGCQFACDLYDNFEVFSNMAWPGVRAAFSGAVKEAKVVSCVSDRLQQYVNESYAPEGRVLTVHNVVDTKQFRSLDRVSCRRQLGLPLDAPLVGYFGAIHPNRGIENLFQGWKLVRQRRPDAWLVLAGKLERGVALPGKSEQVRYLGSLPHAEMPACINSCDVVTIFNVDSPFGRYCFPQKLCEYMACDAPIVATDVGVVHDLLGSKSECVFPLGRLDLFAERVLNFLGNPEVDYERVPTWKEVVEPLEESLRLVAAA